MYVHIDPNSKTAKVLLVLGVLPLMTFLLWWELGTILRSFRSLNWPTAAGVILDSKVDRMRDMHGIPSSTARIRYRYAVAGWNFDNETIAFGAARGSLTWGYADRKVQKFPRGQIVEVSYDPDHPQESCLEPGGLGWEDGAALLLCITGICLGMKQLGEFLCWLFRPRHLS